MSEKHLLLKVNLNNKKYYETTTYAVILFFIFVFIFFFIIFLKSTAWIKFSVAAGRRKIVKMRSV